VNSKPGRVRGRLLLVANLATANVVAALWIVTFLQPSVLGVDLPDVSSAGRMLFLSLDTSAAWLAFFGGALLLVLNFAWLVRRRAPQPPSNWILSETGSGSVRVAREAIESGLRHAGEALAEVTRCRVAVDNSAGRRILVTAQFHCAEGQNHLAASQRLQKALVERFDKLVRLGDGQRAEFELQFQGFAGKLAKNAADLPPPEDDEPAPFTGPQYPIDDDDDDRRGSR